MRAEAGKWADDNWRAGFRDLRDPKTFAEGMAHAAALIEADARARRITHDDDETPERTSHVISWTNAVDEVVERIASGEWLKAGPLPTGRPPGCDCCEWGTPEIVIEYCTTCEAERQRRIADGRCES